MTDMERSCLCALCRRQKETAPVTTVVTSRSHTVANSLNKGPNIISCVNSYPSLYVR